jgi:hypothetical protein
VIQYRLTTPSHDTALHLAQVLTGYGYTATVTGTEVITSPPNLSPAITEFLTFLSHQFEARLDYVS